MRSIKPFTALLLLALLTQATELTDDDPDSDPARFMIVVEHEDGHQCAASLVSIRTGVTTARCARPRGAGDLWAYAASLVSARPPPPPSAAARRVSRVAFAGDGTDPGDPALDIALLELEEPFGVEATSRPILMATSREACEAPLCHAVRALPALPSPPAAAGPVPGRRARLRVVSLSRAPDARCSARVPQWAVSRPRSMCLSGDTLCERDLGGGVVCGGKLCGVLSAVAGDGRAAGQSCGDTLAAQSVSQWRRFLHCAYTFHLCGSGTCAGQCTEQRLMEDHKDISVTFGTALTTVTEIITRFTMASSSYSDNDTPQVLSSDQDATTRGYEEVGARGVSSTFSYFSPPSLSNPSPPSPLPPSSRPPLLSSFPPSLSSTPQYSPTFSLPWPSRTTPTPMPLTMSLFDTSMDSQSASLRASADFEPNRPDFKAGEYGDNVVDYGGGGEEPAPAAQLASRPAEPPSSAPRTPPSTLLQPEHPPPPPARALQVPAAASATGRPWSPRPRTPGGQSRRVLVRLLASL
ncbi:uncharacterized protein LOC116778668 isoform X2 [Danaus plexippus]|uniref:uncharacterized protein LOC116778668 isoform X2 n=1 Tax=Danaus plexippus TaxID=13037 RepID=UPI002AB3060C|nr:uncharacterized protein LOC116778668 isoform X2 [Danaus plexippus]